MRFIGGEYDIEVRDLWQDPAGGMDLRAELV